MTVQYSARVYGTTCSILGDLRIVPHIRDGILKGARYNLNKEIHLGYVNTVKEESPHNIGDYYVSHRGDSLPILTYHHIIQDVVLKPHKNRRKVRILSFDTYRYNLKRNHFYRNGQNPSAFSNNQVRLVFYFV